MKREPRTWVAGWGLALLAAWPAVAGGRTATRQELKMELESRLDVAKTSGMSPEDSEGELSLKNVSDPPIPIVYEAHPLVHLDLDVKDAQGKTLPKSLKRYGYKYSPRSPDPESLTLKPGEAYRTTIGLFSQVNPGSLPTQPATFTVEAVFHHNGGEARSKTVKLEVDPK